MNNLNVFAYQMNIIWEDYEQNIQKIIHIVKKNACNNNLFVFPEMFLTGFSMNINIAVNDNSQYIEILRNLAIEYSVSLCGSLMIEEKGKHFNRFYYFSSTGEIFTYNKRHLFRMGNEHKFYTSGSNKTIIKEKDFNITPFVCYDLRFPVWMRNVNNQYDIIIVVANWPYKRIDAWETLLKARAIENQCYVIGVNRVGEDNNQIIYSGGTCIIDFQGSIVAKTNDFKEDFIEATLCKKSLEEYRYSFPAFKDADSFQINF